MEYRKIAKELHESVNHTYDGYNYILHLDAVVSVANEFSDEINLEYDFPSEVHESHKSIFLKDWIEQACYFHDLLEDTRTTYNDLMNICKNKTVVEIVYAVTNEKGRNRAERASDSYYQGIRETPGASFVKMCDRIANTRYSKMMGSSMFEKYQKENSEFMEKVDAQRFPKMSECLINLFK